MTYDWLNRQTKWTDGERTENTVFAGADWKRASTTVSGADPALNRTVKYLYDDDDVLADFGADNSLVAFYVSPGLDQNLSIADASGATSYYTQDGLGSVRLLTSANGAILNRYDYTAFGETFATNTANTVSNRYTYTAREQSPLAAHGAPMYYRWRNYAPGVRRFMWRDPIGYDGGVNVYEYVHNEPLSRVDCFGLKLKLRVFLFADLTKVPADERDKTELSTFVMLKNNNTLHGASIPVSDYAAANKELRDMQEKRKKDCPCFERLNIYGHGDNNGADGIALRSIYYEKDKKGDQENRLNLDEQGKPNQNFMTLFYGLEFCKQCRIYLRSCKIGKNDALILAIADATGCTVYSSEHNVTNPQWNDKDRDWENMGKPTGGRKWKKTSPSDAGKNKTSSDKMQ